VSENVSKLLALVERQCAELKDTIGLIERLREEIRHLRATLDDQHVRMDASQATMRGTLAPPHPADDAPGDYTRDVAPSAPR
jgi:hypothetical protein